MKLFVSYARVNKLICKEIVALLDGANEIWFDEGIYPGDKWWQEIQNALDWCEGFVYLLTPQSIASEHCKQECEIALSAGKHIFPVLVEGKTVVPDYLHAYQYADLSKGMENGKQLLDAIHVAEVRALKNQLNTHQPVPTPQPKSVSAKQDPHQLFGEAEYAFEAGDYVRSLEILREIKANYSLSARFGRMVEESLTDALTHHERQTYEREAAAEYAPIKILIQSQSKRQRGCRELEDFHQTYPNYDPDNLVEKCRQTKKPKFALAEPFEWVDIPIGVVSLEDESDYFEPGTAGGIYTVPAFCISKYPITVAQYTQFVQDDGYNAQVYWTTDGWRWKNEEAIMSPNYWGVDRFHKPDHPIVGVSWYEAVAFCKWLSAKLNEDITIPTEQQWQSSAQGAHRFVYPWGDNWDSSCCNHSKLSNYEEIQKIGSTSPVTAYPQGASSYGVFDMAGNIWEWVLNKWEKDDISLDGDSQRIIRGGSWWNSESMYFRCKHRAKDDVDSRDNGLGFRIVRSL